MFIHFHKNRKGIYLSKGSKDIVFTLQYFGLPSGDKKQNNVGIPAWIFKNEEYLRSCLRGLIDTDGSVCPITGRDYPYIWFSSNIEKLRETFSQAMEQLGFRTSKWNIKKGRAAEIYLGSKDQINKYINTISFKNSHHLQKIHAPIV